MFLLKSHTSVFHLLEFVNVNLSFIISDVNQDCKSPDFECTEFQGTCAHDGQETFCKCEKDYKGPTCAGILAFYRRT